MLSADAKRLFNAICALSGGSDVYQVLDAAELSRAAELAPDEEALSALIAELKDARMVDVKYATAQRYCLMPLKKAIVQEDVAAEAAYEEAPARRGARSIGVFWQAFLGGALGSAIVGIIIVLIVLFVRV